MPRRLIIAGPNGAGKTTFARTFLPREKMLSFLNTDLLAAGLSPLDPAAAQIAAGRLFLSELDRLAAAHHDFAFETTLSGLGYLSRLRRWRDDGYRLELIYLKLTHVQLSLERVAARVRAGGHNVPEADIRRCFNRSWNNLLKHYQPLADASWVFDVSGITPKLINQTP